MRKSTSSSLKNSPIRKNLKKLTEEKRSLFLQLKEEKKRARQLTSDISILTDAVALAQSTAEYIQQQVHAQISSVVSSCLSAVFSDPYLFQISFVKKRGKTEALLSFVRDGLSVDPMEAAGGGVVDVAAFALRVACVIASYPSLSKLVVADEPFKHVQVDLHPCIAQMLEKLSKEFQIQFIIITHSPALEIGKVVRVSK